MQKLISIIVPCYQAENYIERCITSLLNQSIGIESLELIFVDDASTDRTVEILQEYEKKYPDDIIVIECKQNGRQGRARNLGLEYASGKYIGFVDADDWVETVMYQHMYEKAEAFDCDIVYCRNSRDRDFCYQKKIRNEQEQDKFLLIESMEERKKFMISNIIGVGVWDKLYKRELIFGNQIRFPEYVAYEDIYFGSLFYLYARRVYILEETLYHYFVNWDSTVLMYNQCYYADLEKVNLMKMEEYQKRKVWDKYREELEFDMICSYYLAAMKMFCLRFQEFPYERFLKLQKSIQIHGIDIRHNIYIKSHLSEMNQLLIELSDREVQKEEMEQVAKMYRKAAGVEHMNDFGKADEI